MKKRNIKLMLAGALSAVCVFACLFMTAIRAAGCFELTDAAAVAAGLLSFGNGSLLLPEKEEEKPTQASQRPLAEADSAPKPTELPSQASHSGESLPVTEISLSGSPVYDNISVDNTTPYSPDYAALLSSKLPFTVDDSRAVQVLIYHTHTCESYMSEDTGEYYEDFYPRSTDPEQGVMAVGDRLAAALKAAGIGVVHDKTLHDYPSYEGSYDRSWDTISAYREKYPNIKVTIDLHRDSMTTSQGVKYKPTFTANGSKAAQIMIMTGYDESGDFPFWDENLILAVKLAKSCEDMFPGMTRPLYFGEFTYNMDFNNGSLLIEVGTDANTTDEACLSGECLGKALAAVLKGG